MWNHLGAGATGGPGVPATGEVLVIASDQLTGTLIETALTAAGYSVVVAASGEEGVALYGPGCFVAVLVDLTLPGIDGLEVIQAVRKLDPGQCMLLMTSKPTDSSLRVAVEELHVDDYLTKPFTVGGPFNPLEFAVKRALLVRRLANDNAHLVSELEAANTRFAQLAATDPLTGLANRGKMEEQLRLEVERARRYERPLSFLILDVDHFKPYNDTYGHLAGDHVLEQIARILESCVRTSDVPFRYGGEEFGAVLPESALPDCLAVAERVREAVAAHPFGGTLSQPVTRVTVSIGCSAFPLSAVTPRGLIETADRALYRAKALGRNRVCSHSQTDPSP